MSQVVHTMAFLSCLLKHKPHVYNIFLAQPMELGMHEIQLPSCINRIDPFIVTQGQSPANK